MESDYLSNSYFNKRQQHKYSFSKSPRFTTLRPTCSEVSYELPKIVDSPQAGFGYGTKFTFEKIADKNPSPFQYSIPDTKSRRGFSFGEGREKVKANYYLRTNNELSPSPQKYLPEVTHRGKSFSFISKHKEDSFIPESETPGPGTYKNDYDTDEKTGKRFNSKFRQTGIGQVKERRFKQLQPAELTPGPGTYNSESLYRSSKYPKQDFHKFNQAAKKTYIDLSIKASITPGPVYYVQ